MKKTSTSIIVMLIGLTILTVGLTIIDIYHASTEDNTPIKVAFGMILSFVGGRIFYVSLKSLQAHSEKLAKNTKLLATQVKPASMIVEPSSTPKRNPNKKTPTVNIAIIILLTISLFCLLMLGLFVTFFAFLTAGKIPLFNPVSQFALWGSIINGFVLVMVIINSQPR